MPGIGPTLAVELELTAGVWTAISSYVQRGHIRVGKQYELDRVEAGELVLTLKNRDGRFDPTNTAGPYYPNLQPMRRIRVRLVWAAVTYDLFRGYVERWPQTWDGDGRVGRSELVAKDGLAVLALYELRDAYREEVLRDNPTGYYPLDEADGAASFGSVAVTPQPPAVLRNSKYGAATVTTGADPALPALEDGSVEFSGANGPTKVGSVIELGKDGVGPFTVNQAGTGWSVEVWFVAGNTTDPGLLWAQVARSSSGVLENGGIRLETNGSLTARPTSGGASVTGPFDDGQAHQVVFGFETNGVDWKLYVDGALADSGSLGAAFSSNSPQPGWVLVGGLLTATAQQEFLGTGAAVRVGHVSIYPAMLGSSRVAAHHTAGRTAFAGDLSGTRLGRILDYATWADGRDLAAGQSAMAAAELAGKTALAAWQETVAAEAGGGFIAGDGDATFTDRHARYNQAAAATFADDGADARYGTDLAFDYDDTLIRNIWEVTLPSGLTVRAQDATSKQMPPAGYGPRTQSEQVGLASAVEAGDRAAYGVQRYKDPQLRLPRLPVDPQRQPAVLWPIVLGARIGQLWHVDRDPAGAPLIGFDGIVEGWEHTWTTEVWRSSFALSPADTLSYWQISVAGFSEMNDTTRMAY